MAQSDLADERSTGQYWAGAREVEISEDVVEVELRWRCGVEAGTVGALRADQSLALCMLAAIAFTRTPFGPESPGAATPST